HCRNQRIVRRRTHPVYTAGWRHPSRVSRSFGKHRMTEKNPTLHEVLVIEDDPEIRRFLRAALGAEQYRLREATTAAEGLHQATLPPDVFVLDLGLPDRDGLEVIRKIREKNKRTPIIVLSVRGNEEDKISALDAG